MDTRELWLNSLNKIALPVLSALAANKLKQVLPIKGAALEERGGAEDVFLEAAVNTICAVAPWIESRHKCGEEESKLKEKYRTLARAALGNLTNPTCADYVSLREDGGTQMPSLRLALAGTLAFAVLQAPTQLFEKANAQLKKNLVKELKRASYVRPFQNSLPAQITA